MGCYYEVQGKMTVRKSDNIEERLNDLEDALCGISLGIEELAGDLLKVSIGEYQGGEHMSSTSACEIDDALREFSKDVVSAAYFTTSYDGEAGFVWVGEPEAVAAGQREQRLKKAAAALRELEPDEVSVALKRACIDGFTVKQKAAVKCAYADLAGVYQTLIRDELGVRDHDWKAHRESIIELEQAFDFIEPVSLEDADDEEELVKAIKAEFDSRKPGIFTVDDGKYFVETLSHIYQMIIESDESAIQKDYALVTLAENPVTTAVSGHPKDDSEAMYIILSGLGRDKRLAKEILGLTTDGDHKGCEAMFFFRNRGWVIKLRT